MSAARTYLESSISPGDLYLAMCEGVSALAAKWRRAASFLILKRTCRRTCTLLLSTRPSSLVVLTVIITAMAGFVLARTQIPGKKVLLAIIAITFFLPHGYTIIPVFDVVQLLGMLNTLWSVILVQVAGGMVFNTFLFMGYFSTVQKELDEAAQIDGASFHQRFWYILLPLARPMIATVGLLCFIGSWNNFFVPLVFTLGNDDLRPLGVGLYAFTGQAGTDWQLLCAAAVISLAPIMIVFAFTQKHIVNAYAGAVKA